MTLRTSSSIAIFAAVATLTACTGGEKTVTVIATPTAGASTAPGATRAGETASSAATSAAGSATESVAGTPSAAAGGPADNAPALAAREATKANGGKYKVEVLELRRNGSLMVLELRYTQVDPGIASIGYKFNVSGDPQDDSLSGIYLVDGANKKKYLVARDAQKQCVCSTGLNSVVLNGPKLASSDAPATTLLSASFAAAPEGVTALDVYIPTLGTIRDVPVS